MNIQTLKNLLEDAAQSQDTYDFDITVHTTGGRSVRGAWSYAGEDDGLLIMSKEVPASGPHWFRSNYFASDHIVGFSVDVRP